MGFIWWGRGGDLVDFLGIRRWEMEGPEPVPSRTNSGPNCVFPRVASLQSPMFSFYAGDAALSRVVYRLAGFMAGTLATTGMVACACACAWCAAGACACFGAAEPG